MTTAKIKLSTKVQQGDGSWVLTFSPDYNDGRNKEWAAATPSLYIQMTVREELGDRFELQKAYTLGFEPAEVEEDAPVTGV